MEKTLTAPRCDRKQSLIKRHADSGIRDPGFLPRHSCHWANPNGSPETQADRTDWVSPDQNISAPTKMQVCVVDMTPAR
jgi:hypothetical protein